MSKLKLGLLIFLCTINVCAFAANGVPLDVLREDPYSLDGSTVREAEKNRAKSLDGLYQEEEEEDSDAPLVFTNVQNWPLYPWTDYDITGDEKKENTEESADISADVKKKVKDDEVTAVLKKTKFIHLDAYYCAFYVPAVFNENSAPVFCDYFGDIGSKISAQLFSFGGRFEYDFVKVFSAASGGLGVDTTWSALSKDSVKVNQFTSNIFFTLRFKPTNKFALVAELGGGALTFFEKEKLGLASFIYPELMSAVKLEFYIIPILAFSVEAKFTYPLLIGTSMQYPMIQASAGFGLHF